LIACINTASQSRLSSISKPLATNKGTRSPPHKNQEQKNSERGNYGKRDNFGCAHGLSALTATRCLQNAPAYSAASAARNATISHHRNFSLFIAHGPFTAA
jgi:hypothetical protein